MKTTRDPFSANDVDLKGGHVTSVLLADPDPGTVELLGACVTRAGWRLETVSSADAARGVIVLDRLRAEEFDVVIADLLIPGLDGLGLLRQIRRENPSQPVIMLSSGGSIGEIVSFLKEGVHDVLQKPLDSDAIARAVSRAVSAARDQERAELSYRFIASEGSKYVLTSRELADIRLMLPILDRLYLARMLDLSTKLKLELAFQEMLANALEHGNLALESGWKEVLDETGIDQFSLVKRHRLADDQYADKSVVVQIAFEDSVLSISVEDEGAGFIPDVPDAWRDGVDIPHGRGLQLIFSAADDVKFEKANASGQGTRVTIRKRVTR